jgi:hypothetical protein
MTQTEDEKNKVSLHLDHLTCPLCGGPATFESMARITIQVETAILVPLMCKQCGHGWSIEIHSSPSNALPSDPSAKAVVKLPIVDDPDDTTALVVTGSETTIPEARPSLTTASQNVVIPRPIFWGMIAIMIVLVGMSGWLFNSVQQKGLEDQPTTEKEIASIMIPATAEAEARKSATQQVLDRRATATAEARLQVGIATTATAEWRATATAEGVATISARATIKAEQGATATAEQVAIINMQTTATAERIATATAESVATLSTRGTATAQWQATATAEASVTPALGPRLNVLILGCDTGLDVTRGLGEVKNVWVTVQNAGDEIASDVGVVV